MDDAIIELLKTRPENARLQLNATAQTIALVDEAGKPGEPRSIKPLAELYGPGTGSSNVEFDDKRFLSLMMAIEEAIFDAYGDQPMMTDSGVLAALDRLCMSTESPARGDRLAEEIQFCLRVTLSLNDYSRQDVRLCLRKVKQSATRHNKLAGTRGYLNFIRQQLGKP